MYAIRQISTGWFMPQFGKNQSKGGTWLEPKADCVPRLFRRKQDAKVALGLWLKGKIWVLHSYDFNGEENIGYNVKPTPERQASDMEIIEVEVVVL